MMNDTTSNTASTSYCSLCVDMPWPVLKAVFGCVIFVSNVLTLKALNHCSQLKMSLKYCFTNLAITDALSGALYIYHSVAMFVPTYSSECKIRYWFVSMASAVTLFTLNMLSLDRLFALELPLKYETHVTKKVLIIFTVVCWLIAAMFVTATVIMYQDISVCNFVQLMTRDGFITLAWGCFLLTISIIACHVRIFILARRQIAKILPTMLQQDQAGVSLKLNVKATVTTALVLVPFCLLNIPLFTYFALLAGQSHFRSRDNALDIMDALLFLQVTNSFLNPIIYAWRLPELRRHFPGRLACCKRQSTRQSSSSDENTKTTVVN